ncbi:hypothetical protein AB0F93_00555 [Micromonospora tulbaghiae]|uniref:hypothetical protein n=1 Tax=Micromonospora tulbaghiae TaxID=479978 RepID=UPI00332AEA9F
MTERVFAVDPADGGDDMAVVVLHRTDGGDWRIESAQGRPVDVAAIVAEAVAAAAPVAPLPERLRPDRPLGEQVREWMRRQAVGREEFVLDDEQLRVIGETFARHSRDRTLFVTNATPDGGWADVDATQAARMSPGRVPAQFERFYANNLVTEASESRRRRNP